MFVRVLVLTFAVMATEGAALACGFAGLQPHALDLAEVSGDTQPPAGIDRVGVRIVRGGSEAGCAGGGSSCDDIGRIEVTFADPGDDRTPPGSMGFLVAVASGRTPKGLNLPPATEPIRAPLLFTWIDGAADHQEPFHFQLDVTTVDLAGNLGPTVRVRVRDGGGCSECAGARPSSLILLLGVLGWLVLRATPSRAKPRSWPSRRGRPRSSSR